MTQPAQSLPGGDDPILSPLTNDRDLIFRDVAGTRTKALKLATDGSVPVSGGVSVSSLPLPSNAAQETGGNLAAVAGKDFATQTTLALVKAKTDNLDVALSTRTKPADQQHAIVDSGAVTATLAGNLLISAPLSGQAKIAVTGTAVQLASAVLVNGVILTAKSTNVGIILVGPSGVNNTVDGTGSGYMVEAGASVSLGVANLNTVYINGTAGDIVSWVVS